MTKYVIFGARGSSTYLSAAYTNGKELAQIIQAIKPRVLNSTTRCGGRLLFVLLESMLEV